MTDWTRVVKYQARPWKEIIESTGFTVMWEEGGKKKGKSW